MAVTGRTAVRIEHEDWAPGSFVIIRAQKSRGDEKAITELTYEWRLPSPLPEEVEHEMQREVRRGDDPDLVVARRLVRHTLMDYDTATLVHMIRSWGGDEFSVPADYPASYDEDGNPLTGEDGKIVLHELAGQLCPITPEWIEAQDGPVIAHILGEGRKLWARRSVAQTEAFPGKPAGVAGPKGKRGRA